MKARFRALAQLGRMLMETERNPGTRGQLRGRDASGGAEIVPPENQIPTYAELGLDKKTSKLARAYAGTRLDRII